MKNKKGIISDVGEMVLAGIILIVLAIVIIGIVNSHDEKYKAADKMNSNTLEVSYTTRLILEQEVESNYKMYQFVIDTVNDESYDDFKKKFVKFINEMYGGDAGTWMVKIYKTGETPYGFYSRNPDRTPTAAFQLLPTITIPNPEGGTIEVLFKRISETDYEVDDPEFIKKIRAQGRNLAGDKLGRA